MLEKKGTGLAFLSGPAPMLAGVIGIFGAVYLTVKYMANKKGYHRTSPRTLSVNPNDSVELPLIKVTEISHDTKIFRFGLKEGHRLGLPVGQHINLKAKIDGKLVIRSYTPISSDDDLGFVDLLIKVYLPNERFPEGGKMTQHLNKMQLGDTISVAGPKGRIIYQRNGNFLIRGATAKDENTRKSGVKHIGMIAGGSGITPMMQIVRDVFKSSETTKLSLLFANQTEEDILLREEIEQVKTDYPERFNFMYTVDRPKDGWEYQSGFINKDMCASSLPIPGDDTMILICGPPPMVKFACLPNLKELGFNDDQIFVY
ncbi:unnamed protein product [Oikopleura dioica]|uniref:NADH-cytochrome b5 reductase n=1 Tax=Oikopleura dioica TaxID=34765 RepID=E4YB78_OIKDI|nr:unnamed protein product [Oikopleura dioica]